MEPIAGLSVQVTAEFDAPVTVAVNASVWDRDRTAAAGLNWIFTPADDDCPVMTPWNSNPATRRPAKGFKDVEHAKNLSALFRE